MAVCGRLSSKPGSGGGGPNKLELFSPTSAVATTTEVSFFSSSATTTRANRRRRAVLLVGTHLCLALLLSLSLCLGATALALALAASDEASSLASPQAEEPVPQQPGGKEDSSTTDKASSSCRWAAAGVEEESCGEWSGEFFPTIPQIKYDGPFSSKVLAYKWYNAEEEVLGKKMKHWFRFSVAFWHSFRGDGSDPFGSPTRRWPWEGKNSNPSPKCAMATAKLRMRANFEFLKKLGVDFWCFHDRDIAPEGRNLAESNRNLDEIAELALELQNGTGIRPLWGTAQLFKHPRYMHGAATSPDAKVFAYAAAQVKKAIEVTHRLGGENFVFWGGREGYQSLLNTDMQLELDNLARFLRMAAEYKQKIGFSGTLLLEPKPQEPTKHQYDWDAATTVGFLRAHNLTVGSDDGFKLNLECNHATLSGHSCEHELETARIAGALGGLDANTGDPQTGWDTDEFLVDPVAAAKVAFSLVRNGGLAPGGVNFDAKLRRESIDVEDLFVAHVSGIDALARGLRAVSSILKDKDLKKLVEKRYASWEGPLGKSIVDGSVGFEELEAHALGSEGEPDIVSGKQELAEAYFYRYV